MRILLISPSAAGGHYSEYKGLLTRTFTELGHEVLHFPQHDIKSQIVNQCVPAFARVRLQIRRDALESWKALQACLTHLIENSKCPDLIFFAYLDESIGQYVAKRAIDRKINIPFCGLLFSPPYARRMSKGLLRQGPFDRYSMLKSRWCMSVGVLIEEAIPEFSLLIHKPVIELPDVVSIPGVIQDHSLGEFIRRRADGRLVIGMWGILDKRKGTGEFLCLHPDLSSDRYFFVMGGRIHEKESWPENDKNILDRSISGAIENLLTIGRWLSDDELLSGMLSCDLIFAAYPGFRFSSGIIGKAAALGIPILVNDGFVMARRVKDYNLGFVKPEQADASQWISDNITQIKTLQGSSSFKEGCLKYCERNGYERWSQSLAQLIGPQKEYENYFRRNI